MRSFAVEERLQKILGKIAKKDKTLYHAFQRKVEEILTCENVDHYKNLRKPLQHLKRVHILGPFVLTFLYIKSEDKVIFYDLDHHNNIYQL